ncbi:hypothetical protein CD201_09595 [Hafnia alvei]|jgi:SEC-C motif-containing protein|uniref:YchJ family protein n=1 Tax=Hafnia TaxID=568 RepID=UPI00061D240D|nr:MULTISPECIES: YchJ family protein [Hafnia]AWV44797.1 hypothetical protein CD201_09595 [Hafnia alvei]KID05123.2 hypothetical protein PU01_05280 [Hafnia alvei]KKI42371.1 hypothetical protein XK86_17810 [Hafnia alvei]MBW3478006.1 YchJ family protein [Hafnia alvei]MDU7480649.1 YchJ family protein [Hafnia alvei]
MISAPHTPPDSRSPCPCQSGNMFAQCCEPIISGQRIAAEPEQLMRSRYTAYVVRNVDYLVETWHPECGMDKQRAAIEESFADTEWLGLTIVKTASGKNSDEGFVEFFARYHSEAENQNNSIHECSRFIRLDQRWYYVDGTKPQVGRNDPCPCGSGKKYKKCCGQ